MNFSKSALVNGCVCGGGKNKPFQGPKARNIRFAKEGDGSATNALLRLVLFGHIY